MSQNTKIQEYIVSEHDVINMFAYSGSLPVTAGTVVTFVSTSGWRQTDADSVLFAGSVGASYANTLSPRWGVAAQVKDCGTGDIPLGLLRYDVRETDENGTSWKLYPNKWVENKWTVSGEASPIITKGWVFYSGLTTSAAGTPLAGINAYPSGNGDIVASSAGSAPAYLANRLGKFWGSRDNFNYSLLEIHPN